MISWVWVPICLIVGGIGGFFFAALCAAPGSGGDE